MSNSPDELNPRTTHYEFFGPIGAFFISLFTPAIMYLLYFGCSEQMGGCPPQNISLNVVFHALASPEWWNNIWDAEALWLYLAWYALCVTAWAFLPGEWIEGTKLRNGERKKYRVNAFSTFLIFLSVVSAVILFQGPASFTFIYHKWTGLITATLIMSVFQANYVYVASFVPGKLLALGGNTGNVMYDWFIGRELNPSIGSFDISTFNEHRPGLILWVLINISMACEQAIRRGGLANVTDSMWLVLAFQTWYVADSLYHESALFTTMDVVTDGFGFMLAFGDLSWVPITYSLQARYLVFHPVELGPVATVAIILVNAVGYYIFRDSNGEKNDFRNGRNPKGLKFITTKRGTKLLISGWWGVSRHPNYMGDLILAFSWSLPTGFTTPITYFYFIYFTILLIHRERRDEKACSIKYGPDWIKYKKTVPYRIVPYIY